MKWVKKGLVFQPRRGYPWMQSHAQLPTPDLIEGDLYRIFFASRDRLQRSHIGYVEVDMNAPLDPVKVSENPVLEPGPIGCFDEHGVFPSSILTLGEEKCLYYVGWNKGAEPPLFYASIGLAISRDGGKTFSKVSKAPILSRSEYDPCLVTSPCVYVENGVWRMFYVSGIKWERIQGELKSFYHIKCADSHDGKTWERRGAVAIDFESSEETNIARPCVMKENGRYKMWYSYVRGRQGYRIGYAESPDGFRWTRRDGESGIDVSVLGWDSEALAYPWVFAHKGTKYLLYNGNRFGSEGFGLAVEV
jgi:predicted GH43/DUF377 family glycosyl hydrolase